MREATDNPAQIIKTKFDELMVRIRRLEAVSPIASADLIKRVEVIEARLKIDPPATTASEGK
ncbi:hypothetical protein FAM15346_001851 [Propionibacterium freudenreichii]|uniref:hypothetical protein n=1 Tax=Propionibacterium freudenreichii TaxID=1744 RepID=UPI0005435F4A|nr:hypothetical protein [Propionibacterium freudenreichii]MDK9644785.1 hypothetical protein [Propionibacterium freudenreichii]CEG98122.1 Protein of unknown function [Propionibacterium freudenreichii]